MKKVKRGVKKISNKDIANRNFHRTLAFLIILSILAIVIAGGIQKNGERNVGSCSYLDPIEVDILAFLVGLFLVIEGFFRFYECKGRSLKKNLTRIMRIMVGFAILTIHTLQFIHK